MAHSKADLFHPTLFNQATWCKIQAHPARIIILTHLLEEGPAPFFAFNQKIALAGPTISQHIRYLLKYGIITIEEKYPKAIYAIDKATCGNLAILLTELQFQFSMNK